MNGDSNNITEPLSFNIVKTADNFQRSKTAFITVTGGMSSMFFSKYLSREIGMAEGDSIGFFADEEAIKHDGYKKYGWALYLTKNTLNTCELKRSKKQDMFRINESKISKMLQDVYHIHKGKKVRLMVDVKKPIKINVHGQEIEAYYIYDLPPMRDDLDEVELALYNIDYLTKMTQLKSLGWAA